RAGALAPIGSVPGTERGFVGERGLSAGIIGLPDLPGQPGEGGRAGGETMNWRPQSAVLLAGAVLAFAGCAREKTGEQLPPLVSTVAVEQYAGEATGARYSASIIPYTEVPLAFKTEGYVTYIR